MMNATVGRTGIWLGAVLCLGLSGGLALAQPPANAPDPCQESSATVACPDGAPAQFGESIQVTAFKRPGQQLADASQSVQVFAGEDLELRDVNGPVGALDLIPGASAGVTGGAGTQRYNFRGTGAMGSAGDLAVGFYIDDVAYSSPANPFGPAIRFFDLEALEVLRGPQGTLYGQGALGGTMIVRTAQPSLEQWEVRGRLVGDSMDSGGNGWKEDVTASVPLVRDTLALRVTAGREQRPGLAESPDFAGRSNLDDGRASDYRAKLLYRPTDTVSVRASHWQSNDRGNFGPVYSSVDPPTITGTGGIDGRTRNETALSSLVVDWDTRLGLLRSSSSYTRYDDLYFAGSAFEALINGGLVPFRLKIDALQKTASSSQEVTFTAPHGRAWDWIVGASYINGRRTADVTAEITSPPGIPTGVSRSRTDTTQVAGFGEVSRSFHDGMVTPLLGLRWHRDRRDFLDRGAAEFRADRVLSDVSPRFNLLLRPAKSVELYVNVAKGFRAGTFNTQSNVDIAALFGVTTRVSIPEATLWAYEVGGRFHLLDGNLLLEPAVYDNEYSNYPVEAQIANAGIVVPVRTVTAKGVDLLALYNTPISGLRFFFTGHYNHTQPNATDRAIATQVPALAHGEQLPYVPRWEVNVSGTYAHALGELLSGFAYGSLTRRDGQIDFITARKSPGTTDVTLRCGVRSAKDRWSLALVGKNLTDDRGPALTTGGLQIRYDRRTIGLELTMAFQGAPGR